MSETQEQTAETVREQIITLAKAIQQREADKKKSDGPTESDREIEHALRKSESPRGQQATIDRLAAQVAEQQREIAAALKVLNPNMPESGLEDAARQVKQVAITEAENSTLLEAKLRAVEALRDRIALVLPTLESQELTTVAKTFLEQLTAILTPQEGA